MHFITPLTTRKLEREKREHLNGHRDSKVRHEWVGDVRERKKNPSSQGSSLFSVPAQNSPSELVVPSG